MRRWPLSHPGSRPSQRPPRPISRARAGIPGSRGLRCAWRRATSLCRESLFSDSGNGTRWSRWWVLAGGGISEAAKPRGGLSGQQQKRRRRVLACPVCREGGEYFQATPRAEVSHFAARAVWAIHRMRQALAALGRHDRASIASALVREIEAMTEETGPGHDA